MVLKPPDDDGQRHENSEMCLCPATKYEMVTRTIFIEDGLLTAMPSDLKADAGIHLSDALFRGYILLHARGAYGATIDPRGYYETVFAGA